MNCTSCCKKETAPALALAPARLWSLTTYYLYAFALHTRTVFGDSCGTMLHVANSRRAAQRSHPLKTMKMMYLRLPLHLRLHLPLHLRLRLHLQLQLQSPPPLKNHPQKRKKSPLRQESSLSLARRRRRRKRSHPQMTSKVHINSANRS